jgi:hypothetical protein
MFCSCFIVNVFREAFHEVTKPCGSFFFTSFVMCAYMSIVYAVGADQEQFQAYLDEEEKSLLDNI